jgi:hypothetical protein
MTTWYNDDTPYKICGYPPEKCNGDKCDNCPEICKHNLNTELAKQDK